MHYFYQPRFNQPPYTRQNVYLPVANAQIVNLHPLFEHLNPMNPNYLHYVVQQQPNQNPQPSNRPPYPPVDADILYESANQSNKLMKEASMVLGKLASSKEFGARLMDVAQRSNTKEVERLIQSVGITSDVVVYYNPDGLEMEFRARNLDCCKLSISMRWR
ncbi:hypothetical protein [Ureibacillus aquaedulcis]|uniref:Inner spore coat protein n=1 Tax=Ureibacillus aquaedulcis TaxID=3058421 RepID=A0ABT8GW23_9BACL|nr:hypothetical protein [Ureibacillus sp. BA0131]MDN4495613.1 hypothetical protein [Ureibacillus sp. BA0131]